MLGIWIAPNGDRSKQISVLKQAALEWAGKVRIGHCSPEEAWTALHTNISAKLKYPVAACTFSDKECKSIMFPALKAALPRAGIASNINVDMRDGPIGSLGGGCLSLYHFMGTSRTSIAVGYITHRIPLGNIVLINIEDLVIDAGLYVSIYG